MPADEKTVKRVKTLLDATPTLTIASLADELELPLEDVVGVLDEWRVEPSGDVTHVGPGGGGNWTNG